MDDHFFGIPNLVKSLTEGSNSSQKLSATFWSLLTTHHTHSSSAILIAFHFSSKMEEIVNFQTLKSDLIKSSARKQSIASPYDRDAHPLFPSNLPRRRSFESSMSRGNPISVVFHEPCRIGVSGIPSQVNTQLSRRFSPTITDWAVRGALLPLM